jgi:hypothetical protein
MRTVLLGVLALALAPVVRILVIHLRLRARSHRLAAALRMPAGSSYNEQDADGSTLHVEIGWTRRAALAHQKPAQAVASMSGGSVNSMCQPRRRRQRPHRPGAS